jgi:hypothetical protein
VRDQLGNELIVGDQVHVKVGNEWIIGHIVKVQHGGIAVTGVHNPKHGGPAVGMTSEALVLQIGLGFQGQPGSPQPGLFKLVAPNAVEGIIKSAVM